LEGKWVRFCPAEADGGVQEWDQLPPILTSSLRSVPFPDLGTARDCQSHLCKDCAQHHSR